MDLNLFGANDEMRSSRFAANLKQETYDPLIVTFNSITAGKAEGDKAIQDKVKAIQDKAKSVKDNPQTIHVLTQKMIVANADALPVDLDAAQKKTQDTSCDYVVYVPTSIDISKEKVDAFYESKHQFKKMFGKLNMKDAAASVFMQWDLFQKFMNEFDKPTKQRMLKWIEQSYTNANANKQIVVNDMKNVRNLSDLKVNLPASADVNIHERFVIVYTTPVGTAIPNTAANSLQYLPFSEKFNPITRAFGGVNPAGPFTLKISQKALTYYCNYFQFLYMKNDRHNNIFGSFGRILNYVPPLNSKMPNNTATYVNYMNQNVVPVRYAATSYNVEIITNFLRGVITGNELPNREILRKDNKLKIIQDKTRLYTFKSTPEYNLNYEKLLERLYYKYPCHLTPSVIITKEAKQAIVTAAKLALASFQDCINAAINACDKTKSYSIVCAVAIATREFITNQVSAMAHADAMLTRLFTTIDFGGGANAVLKPQIQAHLTAYATAPIGVGQLRPLIGAACAAGDAVYSAAKLAIMNFVNTNTATNTSASRPPALAAIKKVMDFEIDNLDNFAAFAYDNDTLLSLLKYSDKAQGTGGIATVADAQNPNVSANLLPHANYLKTLYAPQLQQQQKNEFETIHDDELYVICGPVYFDYTWIFKQNPELIKHILGEMNEKDLKELKEGWTSLEDPLTENKYHVNPKPEELSYPKMRFDNPTKLPPETNEKPNSTHTGSYTYVWKEQYVSPSQAMMDKTISELRNNGRKLNSQQFNVQHYNQLSTNTMNWVSHVNALPNKEHYINAICNWTTTGYYRYECTQKITRRNTGGVKTKWENKHVQLMRPPTYENGLQDFTEPNLPTAYPPPLMSIVPPFRGPSNTFVIHSWIPGETFISIDGKLNQPACMDHMYKMMQLIFKTAEKNASDIASKKRICIKIMAVGYESQDIKSLKKINRQEDRQFIGDAFFSAIRDYSMLYESTIRITVYYNTITQQNIKMRYDDYTNQRMSVLRKSDRVATDTSLHLKIADMDDFFTLKWNPESDQLSKDDLLYFVDYCSSPRAFIGNMGEWPDIEEIMDDAIKGNNPQSLLKCLSDAFNPINELYQKRGIKEKMEVVMKNLENWNTIYPTNLVNQQSTQLSSGGFNTLMKTLDDTSADSGGNGRPQIGISDPNTLFVSWWKEISNANAATIIPRNAYISSFDEHVMILHNLLSNSNNVDSTGVVSGWANNMNVFDEHTVANSTANYGPYIHIPFQRNGNNTFENAVYAYTQAKKILTLLSKMKYDEIQIMKTDNDKINNALAALNALDVKMSWSMDAKFTAAVGEGAFIPNSSALHNPFMCPKLLDPKEWQFMDFEEIAVREIAGAEQQLKQLKPFVDKKIQESSMSSAITTASNALIISNQPNVERFKKNVGIILENMFHRNAPMQYDGKNMVFNNYAWNNQLFYKKRNDKAVLQQLTNTNNSPDFARLMGLRPSRKCISFPLFVIQLTMYLYQGNLTDMTGMDVARLSCALDGNMFKTNAQIVWDQMMTGLKTHSQNFTVTQLLSRLGRPTTSEEYGYTAKHDNASATYLIIQVTAATNPTLKTTNVDTLKKIQTEVTKMNLLANPLYSNGNHGINALVVLADAYNTAELNAVNGTPATLGWNAAKQTESTMLYMNKVAAKDGSNQTIETELNSLKSGDRIMITDDTAATRVKTRQVWLVTGKPTPNLVHNTIIDVPVTYASARPVNITSLFKANIADDASLTVTLERFTPEELD